MSSAFESQQRWFEEHITPKVKQLREWAANGSSVSSPLLNSFLKELLIELEVVDLDNYTVELYIDEILDGARTLEHKGLIESRDQIRPLALMALLPNTLDRALFSEYWNTYRPFSRKYPELKDESLVRAFKFSTNLKKLADYIESNVQVTTN